MENLTAPRTDAEPNQHREATQNGNVKVTRSDWLHAARDVLVTRGVGEVKVLALSEQLNVSRSSFYWYFKNRRELLDGLLVDWEATNIQKIVRYCERPASGIDEAVCNFFQCFMRPELFDQRLDFAIREWARRDKTVRQRIDAADETRLNAVTAMFARHDYSAQEADHRARIIYFMQLGYHALEVNETLETRLSRVEGYLKAFTGRDPDPQVLANFEAFAQQNSEN
ncbi:MAG: TetR/AcrR family transcriptional regulator [Pseudomonadota bacterium]